MEDRVQSYMEQQGYVESSESEAVEETSGEEMSECESSESSESSVFESYGLLKEEFLTH